uniref:Chromo domain-containing protein n=1 Tax=Peronospora matthiolae TaxID=2874970 RepID=A0AAV1UVL4_9STRA
MSTSDHPETDGQMERVNRVFEEILRGYVHSFTSWSDFLPMAEFAVNNSVHASTTHTPFFVNGLRHPLLPSFLDCDSSLDADVDHINIDDDDDDDAGIFSIDDDDDDDDAGTFIIDNNCHTEDDDALTGEDNFLSAVHTKRTAVNKDESAEEFLLNREAVVRFVRNSIADAIYKQKRNADKHGRANVLSFIEGELALPSPVNLPKHAVTYVDRSKLLPSFTLGVSARTISTRSLREAKNSSAVKGRDHLRVVPFQRASMVDYRSDLLTQLINVLTSRSQLVTKRTNRTFALKLRERKRVSEHQYDPTLEPDQVFPPPPHPLVISGGVQRFLVERILNHRDENGVRTSYRVRWRGYTPAWDSWEPRAQLIVDVPGLVEKYDKTHPLRSKKGRRKTTSPNASTGIEKI